MGNAKYDTETLKEKLKEKGYKLTPQRRAIVDLIVSKEGEHLTAEEIYDEVKDDLLDELEDRIEQTYSFKILDHSVKFFGICAKCSKK